MKRRKVVPPAMRKRNIAARETSSKRALIVPILEWTGFWVCIVMMCASLVSVRWGFQWASPAAHHLVGLRGGAVLYFGFRINPPLGPEFYESLIQLPNWGFSALYRGGYSFYPLPSIEIGHPSTRRTDLTVIIPLWIPILLVGIPMFLLWRRGRIPLGHCSSCGYNLRGNVSGACPECGAKCPPVARLPPGRHVDEEQG